MRIQRSKLSSLVNFLLGASWALVFISIIFTFLSYFHFSFIDAILMSFFAALPGLFLVVLLEYIIAGQAKLDEIQKQTKLLEEILAEIKKS
jgi:hypothetical protein